MLVVMRGFSKKTTLMSPRNSLLSVVNYNNICRQISSDVFQDKERAEEYIYIRQLEKENMDLLKKKLKGNAERCDGPERRSKIPSEPLTSKNQK